jgi:hypothetical protein
MKLQQQVFVRPSKSRLNLRQAQVSKPLPQSKIALWINEISFLIRSAVFLPTAGLNPESRTLYPEPGTQNPEPRTFQPKVSPAEAPHRYPTA